MHTIDTMGYGHKKYRPPLSPTSFYHHDMYSRPTTLRPQSEYRFAGGGGPQYSSSWSGGSRSGGLCSAALIGGALLAAIAVLGVAALAFYMGALRPDKGEPIITFEGVFRVSRGDVYGGAPDSPAWKERARKYGAALRQIYGAPSPLRQAFAGALVTGFGDRKLDVHFRLYLDRRKIPSSVSNIEELLKNILVQDQISKHPALGQIKIDTTSIVIKRDLEHTYHSESYVKEALNESMAISPIKGTQPGPKDKVLQSRVGVVRKTTVKPNTNKNKEINEADIDTENLPVVQGTFQITKTEADITENKQTSPPRSDDKPNVKPQTVPKSTTTTKQPTTRKAVNTTPKPRPFTIMSTLNVKQKNEMTTPKNTKEAKLSTTVTTPSSTSSTPTTTVSISSSTNNVSQLLLDLLTNENHFKDLPKIDTLFTVPHVVDNEPWRPITRPYYDTTTKPLPEVFLVDQAEDRIGVAEVEVVEDITGLESMLTPIPPTRHRDKTTTTRPKIIHDVVPDLAADVYVPGPIYTSFTLPTYTPPLKNMETLGSSFPKPHPIPVDKISSVVEEVNYSGSYDEDDGKPKTRPPKDKTTSVAINVLQFDQPDNNTKKISVEGASIVKKSNETQKVTTSTSTPTTTTSSTTTSSPSTTEDATEAISISTIKSEILTTSTIEPIADRSDDIELESMTNEHIKENSTKRPNNKVSQIPSTGAPHHTWELVNTSNQNSSTTKFSPEKVYNDTLQAIITKNDAVFPNTTPKFTGKVSILKNLTDIIKKYTQNITEKLPQETRQTSSKPVIDEVRQHSDKMVGSSEVISEDEFDITTPNIVLPTLLPAKSNLAGPLRPRPRPKSPNRKQGTNSNSQMRFFREHSQKVADQVNDDDSSAPDIITAPPLDDISQVLFANVTDTLTVMVNATDNSNRLPKTRNDLNNDDEFVDNGEIKHVPDGTYRVSYHVTGSVSTKQANETKHLPAYELTLEPDVVLEIPSNQSNPLTTDKLRELANLATISELNNNTLFKSPGGVISTKAIPSSYTLNQAGFKILTKTYNKIQSTKNDDFYNKGHVDKNYEKLNKPEKNYVNHNEVVKEEICSNLTSFRCFTGACLPLTSRCNRLLDCPDGEDEHICSCADYLRAEFSQSKICDGVVDCWDYSDENNCDWCEKGQYVCANARQCIDHDQVCDGNPDCPLGDDEKSCVALSENVDRNEVVPYSEEGFVMVRKRGVWGRLCVESFKDVVAEAHSSLQLPDLGRAVCKAMTFQDSGYAREAREGRKSSSVGYWEVWHNPEARAVDARLTFRRSTCPKRKALRIRCANLECGIRPHADAQQPRVVGGGGAAAGAWPWQAALYRDGEFQCGATLVARDWLLSASHCFYQATEAHWVARLGALRRGAWPRGPWERVVHVREVVLHPRYAPRGFRNDIALLRIEPTSLHARLRPACLPPARVQPPAGHHCTVVGWGQLYEHERVFPDTLQEVELPVISTAECRRRTRLLPLYRVTDDMFCAGYERGGRDACLGDSGGPLMCQEADNKWYIYGVTSNGYGCARANRPGVYTKVSNYIDWIESVMATHAANDTAPELSEEAFYADLEVAENRRTGKVRTDSCKGHRCPLGECLPPSSVCNGFLECSDGSDEKDCNKTTDNSSSDNPD